MSSGMMDAFDTRAADAARLAQLRIMLGDVDQMLVLAGALVASGRRVELAGLDASVGRLCAHALDLPPAEGSSVRLALAGLLTRINALEAALRQAAPTA